MLYFISWLTDFSIILFVFTGTRYLAEQGASPSLLGVLGASFFLSSAISNAWSGHVADRVGLRRVALRGMSMFLASLACVAVVPPDSVLFYIAYASVGISVGQIYPPVMAWLGHGKSGAAARRVYLWFCLAFNLGIVSAQLTGGWMYEQLGSRVPLIVAMTLAAIGFACLFVAKAPPVRRHGDPLPHEESDDARLARAFARLTWIANFGGMFSMSILWFLFPVLVVGLGVTPGSHGIILAVGRVVVMSTFCVMYLFPFWQFRFQVAASAQALGAVGLIIISLAQSTFALACGVAALSALMGHNYFASLFYSARGNAQERKGRAFGLVEASLGFGAAGGSFFGGLVGADLGSRAPFIMAASVVITLLIVQTVAYRKLVRPLRGPRLPVDEAASVESVATAEAM